MAEPTVKPVATRSAARAEAAKTAKSKRNNTAKTQKSGKAGAAALNPKQKKIIIISAVAFVLALVLVISIVLGVKGCSSTDGIPAPGVTVSSVADSHMNKTQVGYSGEIVGTVQRNKPVEGVHDEGLSAKGYPKYGSTLNLTTSEKTTLIQENRKLTANGTWVDASMRTSGTYDKMDKDGYLYKKDGSAPGAGVPERLYKHTGSVGLYGGNVSDDEPAVVKSLTIRPRSYSSYYSVTGLYAPAGEVIKVQMTSADMNATGGITIHIGQALYNGQANNIWEQRGVNRMPIILNTMVVTKETATYDETTGLWTGYVGSFLGGPIYVRGASSTFSVTISGGVHYAHFILGVTTEEEYAVYSKSTAPYFDLEVWDRGVLHSGPKRKVQSFSYDDLYKAAVLWEKIALVTTSVSNQGIVFLYDPFVAAGAAVAFPGRRSVNCPEGWITGSLNYSAFVTSGSWGNMHEYHHNFQDYGLGSGADGEVTNNGLNLVSYSLFTKISSARQLAGYGGSGLSGWNQYTSAPWALQRVNAGAIGSTNGLAIYATLLHNFGQDAYIKARGARGVNNYFNKWATNTHQDFTYYAGLVSSYGGGAYSPSEAVKNANYPLFVPVSSVYQTGRIYNYDGEKREITTMQPYVIPYGKSFKVDLNAYTVNSGGQYQSGSVVIAKDFKCSVKSVKTDGINGTFVKTDTDGVYTFTPNKELRSGKIYVTLEITTAAKGEHEWNGHKLEDVDLILEFQQSHESNKNVLERTVYTYDAGSMYTDAIQAFQSNFKNYETVTTKDHSNPVQNANTDIWCWPTTSGHESYLETHPEYFATDNAIHVIDGKLYFPADGKYRVFLRGRFNCAVYYSLDGKDYTLGAYINDDQTTDKFRPSSEETYFDVEFDENFVYFNSSTTPAAKAFSGDRWLYVKEILIAQTSPRASYIGLGMSQWTMPMYTAEAKYFITLGDAKTYVTEETVGNSTRYYYTVSGIKHYIEQDGTRYYYDEFEEKKEEPNIGAVEVESIYKDKDGKVVSAEVANNAEYTPPEVTDKNQPYATAYRRTYEFQKEFTSEYFYVRNYNYNYIGTPEDFSTWDEGVTLADTNYTPETAPYGIDNLFKQGQDTYTHSSANKGSGVYITLDMGKQITANSITFLGRTDRAQSTAWQGLPNSFTLAISNDGTNFEEVGTYTNSSGAVHSATVNLGKDIKFRYIKITVNSTHSNTGRLILSGIKFTYAFKLTGNGNNHISPDDERFIYKGNWKVAQTNSCFGHVSLGNAGDEVSFEFDAKTDGSRFGILSSNKYGQNYEVYIDGKKVDGQRVKDDPNDIAIRYLTPELSQGKHKVVIKCTGEANIDSFVLY